MVITSKLVRGEREPLNEKLEDKDDPKEEVEHQMVEQDDPNFPDLGSEPEKA